MQEVARGIGMDNRIGTASSSMPVPGYRRLLLPQGYARRCSRSAGDNDDVRLRIVEATVLAVNDEPQARHGRAR